MQLEALQIDIRPGSHAAAIDLGQPLLRRYWRSVYLAWWLPWLALALLLWAILPRDDLAWGTLAMWWLRPLFDRLPLYILSREVFGEHVTAWQALRAWPRQLGGWLRFLTIWRPFMVGRGLYAPIWMLEGARGKFALQRRRALGARGAYGAASWFGVACLHFTLVFELAAYGLVAMFAITPDDMSALEALGKYLVQPEVVALAGHISYVLADGLIGPVYSAGCFTLYLRRRAELEGWDIELALRRMAQRRARLLKPLGSAVAALLCAAVFMLPQPRAHAAEPVLSASRPAVVPAAHAASGAADGQCELPSYVTAQQKERGTAHDAEQDAVRRDLETVRASEDFRTWKCELRWVEKKRDIKAGKDSESWLYRFLRWLFDRDGPSRSRDSNSGIGLGSADMLKLVLVAGLVGLLAWLLWRNRERLSVLLASVKVRPPLPDEICGLDIRPESLPDDVPAGVRRLWGEGRQRDALALLYRATVSRLAHDHALELHAGDTEGDVLRAGRRAAEAQRLPAQALDACRDVTEIWSAAAYADQWPVAERLEQVLQRWRSALAEVRA
ncbi:protein of unknown function [Andreprevotia lacus DSM 23236]|uniref:DUF4129 domain-containing protein n=1 Tax=Andreprevotia lacus DSM 23236 TaxID=1121001 RepID=A0A1W1XSX7_9NEIS|nr:DUF4129 domain-containing protein [Andreprevotia lacus]SMC27080.1 protein of unknown function [Andreprevotia lacus DSM 23236]